MVTYTMNLTLSDSLLGRQRTRQWSPLVTQQYRLRHLHQIFGLNFPHLPRKGSYYFTLHLTPMSAPFYTSEKVNNANPKWLEIDPRIIPNFGATALVLRVWQQSPGCPDSMISTWGVHFSGLVYLGNKIADIQPSFFGPNTVIFVIKGGFFTSRSALKEKCNTQKMFRKIRVQGVKSEVRDSYELEKLRRLHALQISISNQSLDVQLVKDKIEVKCEADDVQSVAEMARESSHSNVRYAPQMLTMKSVNRMLEQKPTKMQRQEMEKMRNEIEIRQFKTKLLSHERDKKSVQIRNYKTKLKDLVDNNEKKNIELMNSYQELSKDAALLKDMIKNMVPSQDMLMTLHSKLSQRRRQLLRQLLSIYPVHQLTEKKYTIHGIHVPNSDVLTDCSDVGISVALGYITHVLLMCSMFLQVPLRYPMTHYGSRSYITDLVSMILHDRERDFPLFTKGKEKVQFSYAVYLMNKNIAQLRWLCFMHTQDLKATLPNLLTFLEGTNCGNVPPLVISSMALKTDSEYLQSHKIEERFLDIPKKYGKIYRRCECGPGLSEILAVPEAFMNKQISSDSFKNFVAAKHAAEKSSAIVIKEGTVDNEKVCDICEEGIEQGTDMLDPELNLGELNEAETRVEMKDSQKEILEELMASGSTGDCCGNEEKSPICDTFLSAAIQNPLTARTDALLNTKSFNLVRSKPNL